MSTFSITEYIHRWASPSLCIIATTNILCHLYQRYTEHPSALRLCTLKKRGLLHVANPRYSFVNYSETEQEEAGDTLNHTFYIPAFPPDLKLYVYYYGTKNGQPLASQTCIIYTDYGQLSGPPMPKFYNASLTNWFHITETNWQDITDLSITFEAPTIYVSLILAHIPRIRNTNGANKTFVRLIGDFIDPVECLVGPSGQANTFFALELHDLRRCDPPGPYNIKLQAKVDGADAWIEAHETYSATLDILLLQV